MSTTVRETNMSEPLSALCRIKILSRQLPKHLIFTAALPSFATASCPIPVKMKQVCWPKQVLDKTS